MIESKLQGLLWNQALNQVGKQVTYQIWDQVTDGTGDRGWGRVVQMKYRIWEQMSIQCNDK